MGLHDGVKQSSGTTEIKPHKTDPVRGWQELVGMPAA